MTFSFVARRRARFTCVPPAILLVVAGAAGRVALAQPSDCPPPPPLVLIAPSVVGAGSPNRTAFIADFAGVTYAWTITNGTITSGLGTHQITFTAGVAGTPLDLAVSLTTTDGCPYGGGFAIVTVAPVGNAVLFYTLTPCRLVDTRDPDGPRGGPAIAAAGGTDRAFVLTGACGIPIGATSVSVSMAVAAPEAAGGFTLYAGDGSPNGTSSISFRVGQTRANNAILELATDGSGTIRVENASSGAAHLILDVNGFFQ